MGLDGDLRNRGLWQGMFAKGQLWVWWLLDQSGIINKYEVHWKVKLLYTGKGEIIESGLRAWTVGHMGYRLAVHLYQDTY